MTQRSSIKEPAMKKQKRTSQTSVASTHKYPSFKSSGKEQQDLYTVLSKRKVLPNKYVDPSSLELLRIKEEFVGYLYDVGWSDLMTMDEPSYPLLTYEFLSSFTVVDENTISFRIANVQHEITKSELGSMFGWQLEGQQPLPEGYATPFWLKITGLSAPASYGTQRALSSEIVSHCDRYFARLMSYTIYGRAESNNKIQMGELSLLYYFDEGLLVDWTNLLINRFLYQAKRTTGAIVIGGFITRIAEKLGVFDRHKTNLKVADGWSPTINAEYLIGMHMLYRDHVYGLKIVPHPRRLAPVEEHVPEPKQTLKEQVAGVQRSQTQLLQKLKSMEQQMANMFAYMKQHLPHQAS